MGLDAPDYQAPPPDYQGLWSTYSGWINDLNEQFSTRLSGARARLGAQGVQRDSDIWRQEEETIRQDYETQLEELRGTETYGVLQGGLPAAPGTEFRDWLNAAYDAVGGRPQSEDDPLRTRMDAAVWRDQNPYETWRRQIEEETGGGTRSVEEHFAEIYGWEGRRDPFAQDLPAPDAGANLRQSQPLWV